jgi:gas vesicle protein
VGTTEDALRREAAMERERMGDTLEAIGDRLSPERMVQRRRAAVGQAWYRMRTSIMGSPDYEEPATSRMSELFEHSGAPAMHTAKQGAQTAVDTAKEAAQGVQHGIQQAPETIKEQAAGNPIAAGLVAFGAGMLLASLLPKSRTEERVAQQARPQLEGAMEQLKSAGQDVASQAKEHAQDAAQELKSTGTEAASNVAEQTRESSREVAADLRGGQPR